jgi:tyrosyl-tRNA synthetase
MLIQGLDFKYLHENRGVDLQVAGSDQWGNITTGIELIRKTTGDEVYAFTMPLVTDSHGNKFGKSEGNAVWLDKNKTSSYELYQFLLNSEDSMVIEYLKRLTFLTREEIEAIEAEHNQAPEKRLAQKKLAEEILRDLHGEGAYENAVKISELLFAGKIKEIPVNDLLAGLRDVPHFETSGGAIMDVLVSSGICSSKREAREFISGGSLTVNGEPLRSTDLEINADTALAGKYIVVRRGKKKYYLGELV